MEVKFIGMCLVLAGCAGMGIYFRMREIARYRNLQEIQKAVLVIRGEIVSMRTPLPDALTQAARRARGPVATFLTAVSGELDRGGGDLGAVWQDCLKDCIPVMQLREEDRGEFGRLGETLGYLDVEMQLQNIDLYRERLALSIRGMEQEKGKRSGLYPVIGTAAGILLCILIL